MSEPFLNRFHGNAICQKQTRTGMPQVMETEFLQLMFLNHIPEVVSHKIRSNQISEVIRADKIVIIMIVSTPERSGKILILHLFSLQQFSNVRNQGQRSETGFYFELVLELDNELSVFMAFIAYLYTQHSIKNFFVVAPNTTIYEKLQRDLRDSNSPKYVFRGLSCFVNQPEIITGEDYRNKPLPDFQNDIKIFIFNIDKFNKENSNMKHINEYYGDSFYQTLANLPDLVLIMDESHHYHGEKGEQALNELHPLLGLELTATPLTAKKKSGKQVPFKNVVYEYPLSQAISDGYTRTPYAVTRSDVQFYHFGDEQLDRLMLQDGILLHERIKTKLHAYAVNEGKSLVKPFMLVVCKDTDHAKWAEEYIKSDKFQNGAYRNKIVVIHSKQLGAESEANTKMLLKVEKADNPIEIVIHVNMLKEGWDVNNLYTIVPLRTAASKILREQMVGRGLRLPYGERTGDNDVDSV